MSFGRGGHVAPKSPLSRSTARCLRASLKWRYRALLLSEDPPSLPGTGSLRLRSLRLRSGQAGQDARGWGTREGALRHD